ncbi:MAG TPA: hypothetical protein VLZ50_09555 [Terracidiphilus sp.]|nr:hypothetical protein [Terracidiphilus sp.]
MKSCTGTPAELCALPYLEGVLPEHQVELFEAHFFECPICFAYLQDLQAISAALARHPEIPGIKEEKPARRRLLPFPARTWALGAAAAMVLAVAVISFRALHPGQQQAPIALTAPAAPLPAKPTGPTRATSAAPLRPSQLADLALPPFVAPNLRGAQEDTRFESGMNDYENGDCRGAVAELSSVPARSEDARAARFYCAACEMRLGNLTEAAADMGKVATDGDAPQQESALYYEAQIALAADRPATAHRYLMRTIALEGDLEQKARDEDRRVQEMLNESPGESREKPESIAR